MRSVKTILGLFCVVLRLTAGLFQIPAAPTYLSAEERAADIERAQAPVVWQDTLILTYQSPEPVRYVGVRFEHEDYRRLHIYHRRPSVRTVRSNDPETGELVFDRERVWTEDLFYLIYRDLPSDGPIRYRIVVDGLWMPDPNAEKQLDPYSGSILSVVTVPQRSQEHQTVDKVRDRLYKFTLRAAPGSMVSVVGSFNNWDPYMTPLTASAEEGGLFTADVRLSPGTHWYGFVVDGQWREPPNGGLWRLDGRGRRIFRLDVAEAPHREPVRSLYAD